MSKKRCPAPGAQAKRGSFGPIAAFIPVRLIWSEIATREPCGMSARIPPAALVTINVLHPSNPSTRVGNVTWSIG